MAVKPYIEGTAPQEDNFAKPKIKVPVRTFSQVSGCHLPYIYTQLK